MRSHPPIQITTNMWVVLREYLQQPKAVTHQITNTQGEARYLLMTWATVEADRRLVGIHESLQAAYDAILPCYTQASPHRAEPSSTEQYFGGIGLSPGYPTLLAYISNPELTV